MTEDKPGKRTTRHSRPNWPTFGDTKRLTVDLPPSLHAEFKAACVRKGTAMNEEIIWLLETWLEQQPVI
jgi:hypothetical protein